MARSTSATTNLITNKDRDALGWAPRVSVSQLVNYGGGDLEAYEADAQHSP